MKVNITLLTMMICAGRTKRRAMLLAVLAESCRMLSEPPGGVGPSGGVVMD